MDAVSDHVCSPSVIGQTRMTLRQLQQQLLLWLLLLPSLAVLHTKCYTEHNRFRHRCNETGVHDTATAAAAEVMSAAGLCYSDVSSQPAHVVTVG
jgi:hypothetical protein